MGSHFHGWIDYNGVAFSLELLEWDRTFSGFGGSENSGWSGAHNPMGSWVGRDLKIGRVSLH